MKISIHITPNAKRTELIGEETNLFGEKYLKIKVAAPPIEGKANKELVDFLAKHFEVSKSNISIVTGDKSRNKIIEIKK
jgi:uncharacterized protein